MTYRKLVEEALEMFKSIGIEDPKLISSKNPSYGELTSLVAFDIAKERGGDPRKIADEIAMSLSSCSGRIIESIEAVSGYINFKVDWIKYSEEILKTVIGLGLDYGRSSIGTGRKIMVEHTSVNPNKALHVGHARNVCLGDTLYRLFSFLGYDVTVLNYIDDSGTQMADIILGFTELGYPLDPVDGSRFDAYCGDVVYIEVSRRVEEDPSLAEKRRKIAKMIEERDEKYYRLNRMIAEKVLRDQLKTCWRLGARYHILNMESDILSYDLWSEVFEKLIKVGAVYRAESGLKAGCWLLDLSSHPVLGKEGDEVLVKSDGSTTYVARDIAYGAWKLGETIIRETIYKKALIVLNKADSTMPSELDKLKNMMESLQIPFTYISAEKKENLEDLKEKIFKSLRLIRVYTQKDGVVSRKPIVMNENITVRELAERIHKDLARNMKYARIWGRSVKIQGQQVGSDHILQDGDIVEIYSS